jgi:hypothetical protein
MVLKRGVGVVNGLARYLHRVSCNAGCNAAMLCVDTGVMQGVMLRLNM